MGACCAASEDLPVNTNPPKASKAAPQGAIKAEPEMPAPEPARPALEDLAPPKSWGLRDEIQAFEQSLPFNRVEVEQAIALVDVAEAAEKGKGGAEGSVSLASLSEVFDSPAWAPLKDSNSVLAKLLLSETFKDAEKGTEADKIDVDTLKCFFLFHAQGKERAKAVALYNILQEGGLEAHDQITATDKDFKPNFVRLCSLATKDIFKLAHELGEEVAEHYTEDECATMLSEDNIEALIEDEFLEAVYGAKSRLENEVWLTNVSDKKAKWIFTVEEMRTKILAQAGIEKKH